MSRINDQYDDRRVREYGDHHRRDHEEQARYGGSHRPSTRERSRSPDEEKERLERERRARMARLRAENEEEEQQLTAHDQSGGPEDNKPRPKEVFVRVDEAELEGLDEQEQMRRLLGFSGGFATTKGQEVEDNRKSAARGVAAKNKARKYRQYMNRKGGFNRPLDKMN